jgi:hypothetical protein
MGCESQMLECCADKGHSFTSHSPSPAFSTVAFPVTQIVGDASERYCDAECNGGYVRRYTEYLAARS